MKYSIFGFLVLAILTFAACEKGDKLKSFGDKEDYDKGCFELVYPVKYTMPDGSTVTGNDEKEVWAAIKVWYEAHPDSKAKPSLEYPVEITYGDDKTKTIADEATMILAKKACIDDKGDYKKACFELVYPVTYTMPDGSTVTGNDEKELWIEIKDWYKAHPDSKAKPVLQYPVKISFGDDAIKTIEDEATMILAKKACKDDKNDKGDEKKECFNLIYPVTYMMPDGSMVTGNDEKETWAAIKAWYEAHPDSKAKPILQYPVKINFVGDDAIKTIEDEAAMLLVKKACYDDKGDTGIGGG